MKRVVSLLFILLSGCANECTVNPGLTALLENDQKLITQDDVNVFINDPIHNVSIMWSCRF